MSDYTDDERAAVVKVLDSWGIRKQREDIAANILAAVAPAIAARARQAQLDDAVAFVRAFENQWGDEPGWYELAGHLARTVAPRVESETVPECSPEGSNDE